MKWWPWSKDKDDEKQEKKREEPYFDPNDAALAGIRPADEDGRKEPTFETPRRPFAEPQQDEAEEKESEGMTAEEVFTKNTPWTLPPAWKAVYDNDVSPELRDLIADDGNAWTSDEKTGTTYFKLRGGEEVFMGETEVEGNQTDFVGVNTDFNKLTEDAADAIVELAKSRGWKKIDVVGTDDEKAMLWGKAMVAGLEVANFKPTEDQLKVIAEREMKRQAEKQAKAEQEQQAGAPGVTQGSGKSLGDGPAAEGAEGPVAGQDAEDEAKPAPQKPELPPLSLEEIQNTVKQVDDRNRERAMQNATLKGSYDLGPSENMMNVLGEALSRVADETKDEKNAGSTASLAVITKDGELAVANLGDSPVVLYLRDKETGEMHVQEFFEEHRADNPYESDRIREEGGVVFNDKIKGSPVGFLANEDGKLVPLSRGFGDKDVPGLSRAPDAMQVALKDEIADGYEAYVLVMSQGVIDPNPKNMAGGPEQVEAYYSVTNQTFGEIIGKAAEEGKLDEVPQRIADFAKEHGSGDNISVMFAQVPEAPRDRDIVLGLADGHGYGGKRFAHEVMDKLQGELKALDRNPLPEPEPKKAPAATKEVKAEPLAKDDGAAKGGAKKTARGKNGKTPHESADTKRKTTKKKTAAKTKTSGNGKDTGVDSKIAGDGGAKKKAAAKKKSAPRKKRTGQRKTP